MEEEKKISQHIEFVNTYANELFEYTDYEKQGVKLNSTLKNKTFEDIENKINILYEKTRSLEEIIKYSRTFLKEKITTKKDEIRRMTIEIETSSDDLKNEDFIFENIDFSRDNRTEIRDRDGNGIAKANISKGKIIVSGFNLLDADVQSYSRKGEVAVYKNNIISAIKDGWYRVIYMLDGIASNGVREVLEITLAKPTRINFLKIEQSNCKIENINFINSAGVIEQVDDRENEYVGIRTIDKIQITLNSTRYRRETYQTYSRSNWERNFWNTLSNSIFESKNLGLEFSISYIENISGKNQYEADWAEHTRIVEAHKVEQAKVDAKNIQIDIRNNERDRIFREAQAARDEAERLLNQKIKDQLAKDREADKNN